MSQRLRKAGAPTGEKLKRSRVLESAVSARPMLLVCESPSRVGRGLARAAACVPCIFADKAVPREEDQEEGDIMLKETRAEWV